MSSSISAVALAIDDSRLRVAQAEGYMFRGCSE
jgi:hypothetical protein